MIEGINVEFKREFVEEIRLTVLAFANTDGGTLYIGVENDYYLYHKRPQELNNHLIHDCL